MGVNALNDEMLAEANLHAVYGLYLRLAHKATPLPHETLRSIVNSLEKACKNDLPKPWKERDSFRLNILINAMVHFPIAANAKIDDLSRSRNGLTACTFTDAKGGVSVIFKGTGKGEWIDNGEGLSGIPEGNTYISYGKDGKILSRKTVKNDYATDQQVEALNWFRYLAAKHRWSTRTKLTVSGHSKGGNKAQFITIHSDLIDKCYSFDGQGFSPEALSALKKITGLAFERRRQHIYSLSADNDYVNVLGERLMPDDHICFLESSRGFHHLESILDINGRFRPQCEQGSLSRYIESVSERLMKMPPAIRQHVTLAVMNLFQKYLGSDSPVNGDTVSTEQTIAGLSIALGLLLSGDN